MSRLPRMPGALLVLVALLLLLAAHVHADGGLWESERSAGEGAAGASARSGSSRSSSSGRDPSSLWFERLDEAELAEHYSSAPVSPDGGVPSALSQIGQLVAPLHHTSLVDVILVGFAGDGDAAVVLDGPELARYLQAAGLGRDQARTTVAALDAEYSLDGAGAGGHELPFVTKFLYRVQQAHPTLRNDIQTALQNAVDDTVERNPHIVRLPPSRPAANSAKRGAAPQPRAARPSVPVPAYIVDEVVAEHYADMGLSTSIYLLNLAPVTLRADGSGAANQPTPPDGGQPEPERLRYIYTQESRPNATTVGVPPDPSGCPTSHWVSPSSRYAWFDLTAGPLSYGPQTWGDGIVTEYAVPNTRRMMESQLRYERKAWRVASIPLAGASSETDELQPFQPSNTLNAHFKHQLLSELALLVSKVTRGLLQPAASHWPVPYAPTLKIVLTFVHERHYSAPTVATEAEARSQQMGGGAAGVAEAIKQLLKKKGAHISSSKRNNKGASNEKAERAAWGLYPDGSSAPSSAGEVGGGSDGGGGDSGGWSEWSSLESALLDLSLPGQTIEIENHHLRFEECAQCVEALTHSLRTHTSNIVEGGAAGGLGAGMRTQVHQYLDANELKDWLEHFDAKFWNSGPQASAALSDADAPDEAHQDKVRQARADLGSLDPLKRKAAYAALRTLVPDEFDAESESGATTRVLRVFIYDLATPGIVLLDRYHQSMAFARSGLVLSVQTRAPSAIVDFSCDGRGVAFDPRDSSRATLASILTAGWGVAPSFQRWTPSLNDTEHDFMFTTGHTPFGYFSTSKQLSFAVKDAARRHVLLSELHASMMELATLFPALQSKLSPARRARGPPSSLLDRLLYASAPLDFVRRWNVLSYQQARAAHWLSLNHLQQGWMYAQAAAHDARQMAELLRDELQSLSVTLECGRDAARAADDSVSGLPLAAAASGGGSPSAVAMLSASHYLVFVLLEALMLLIIVIACWTLSNHPHLLARLIPARVAKTLGIQGLLRTKHKDF